MVNKSSAIDNQKSKKEYKKGLVKGTKIFLKKKKKKEVIWSWTI